MFETVRNFRIERKSKKVSQQFYELGSSGQLYGFNFTLSVLDRQQLIKKVWCNNQKVWSVTSQPHLKEKFFQDHLNQETTSIWSVFAAMHGNSKYTSDNSFDPSELRDIAEFIYFTNSSNTPGSIADDQIKLKTIIDANHNFRCYKFMRFVLNEYERAQPFEVDFGNTWSGYGEAIINSIDMIHRMANKYSS